MLKEFLFYGKNKIDFPLDESIEVVDELEKDGHYLVSNSKESNCDIYAPEINFYIKNSKDSIADKIKNIKKLYDIRATIFDLAQDLDFSVEVGNKVLIVSDKAETELKNKLNEWGFTVIVINPLNVLDVNGFIGKLRVTIKKEEELLDVECDQIVWDNAPKFATKQSGVYSSDQLMKIRDNLGSYEYKNFIKYDPNICQYHERNSEICGKCAEVCPTVAILKEDEVKHLAFSHVDCHGCGGCISVCPSGALDYAQMPRGAFFQVTKFFKDSIPLIIPRKMEIENLEVALKEGVLPLAIEGEKFLHEAHLLSLAQTSGAQIVFYTDFISKGTGDVIRVLNEIYMKKYGKELVLVAKDKDELEESLKRASFVDGSRYGINEDGLKKREIFSARLSFLVGADDLGKVKTGEHVHYGNITINESTCTLCLSCVGACNIRALTAHPEDNTLRFNPSICTNCTYCEVVCPEPNTLHVIKDEIDLNPSYFKQNIMAKDELFKCVECGVEFATVKSVERIASMMKPMFLGDEIKIRTLYCCADCKPKVMLQAHIKENR